MCVPKFLKKYFSIAYEDKSIEKSMKARDATLREWLATSHVPARWEVVMVFNNVATRRKILKSTGLVLGATAMPWGARYWANAASGSGLQLEQGIQIGDVQAHRAVIWSRSSRPARLLVEYDFSDDAPLSESLLAIRLA